MMKRTIGSTFFIFLLLFLSCSYKYDIKTVPDDADLFVNGQRIEKDRPFAAKEKKIELVCKRRGYKDHDCTLKRRIPLGTKRVEIDLEAEKYLIEIDTIDGRSEVRRGSNIIGTTPCSLTLEYGVHYLVLSREGYPDQTVRVEAKRSGKLCFRHQKESIPFRQIGIFDAGRSPKQVIYSPEDNYIFIPLIDGFGFKIFDADSLTADRYIEVAENAKSRGFAEGIFIEEKNAFWVSQMLTGEVHEYSYPELEYRRTVDSRGEWPKFLAWTPIHRLVAVSNWASDDVSIIEYSTGEVVRKISTAPAPRGLAFSRDGRFLYVTSFEGGMIQKFSTDDWKEVDSFYKKSAAMRHIALSNDGLRFYVSDMYHDEVYEIEDRSFHIIRTYKVFANPNTICLTPDSRYLFVSCRGPDDKTTYLARSPVNGKIAVIDLVNEEVAFFIDGGNQPTGLDVSNDGNYLCFSNFMDNSIEIYWIGD